jgi:hypothetical protein
MTIANACPTHSRRPLRLNSLDGALAVASRLANLEHTNTTQYAGNWTVGQFLHQE